MSTRERWIIYPILFMTLGIALRDKVIPPEHFGNPNMHFQANAVSAPAIECAELRVGHVVCERLESKRVDARRVRSGRLESEQVASVETECQSLVVTGPGNRPVVVAAADPSTHGGLVETRAANGRPQVQLSANESGGTVTAIERNGTLTLALADLGHDFGLFVKLPGVGSLMSLTLPPWQFEDRPVVPKSPTESPSKPQTKPPAQPPTEP